MTARNRFAVVFPLLFFQTRLSSSFKFASNLSFLESFLVQQVNSLFIVQKKYATLAPEIMMKSREWILYPYSTFHTNGPSRLRTSPFYQ